MGVKSVKQLEPLQATAVVRGFLFIGVCLLVPGVSFSKTPKAPFSEVELHFQICGAKQNLIELSGMGLDQKGSDAKYGAYKLNPEPVLNQVLQFLKLPAEGHETQTVYYLDSLKKSEKSGSSLKENNLILRVRDVTPVKESTDESKKKKSKRNYLLSMKNRVILEKSMSTEAARELLGRMQGVTSVLSLDDKRDSSSCEFDYIYPSLSASCTRTVAIKVSLNDQGADLDEKEASQLYKEEEESFTEFMKTLRLGNLVELFTQTQKKILGKAKRTVWKSKGESNFGPRFVFENWSPLMTPKPDDEHGLPDSKALSWTASPDLKLPEALRPRQLLEYSERISLAQNLDLNGVRESAESAWQSRANGLRKIGLIPCEIPKSKTDFASSTGAKQSELGAE